MSLPHLQTYAQRALRHKNPAANSFLRQSRGKSQILPSAWMSPPQKTFSPSSDVVGPFVCLVKTHIDIIEDFTPSLVAELQALSAKHDFVIFEDRKFADIDRQLVHLTNAHPVPGPSIITGLSSVGLPLGRGLLLLAEMSTKGSLASGSYTEAAPNETTAEEDFLVLTPGVGLDVKGDAMGQQYRTPREVVLESGCDVIIVGRGIYGKDPSLVDSVVAQAKRYREEGWAAYLARIKPL
ncbi:orotidine-5'-monophosphate decarboxylase [Mycena rosella]|uniref:Orotidine 5'-phosphate decarboxylase n=1 Tax=Mycena rosella TaxID=1033263 RepID=A0AAD7D901_MYCRO|nr:orotidine-5'-monophosphate decarboxylase [Mycena rosella]